MTAKIVRCPIRRTAALRLGLRRITPETARPRPLMLTPPALTDKQFDEFLAEFGGRLTRTRFAGYRQA